MAIDAKIVSFLSPSASGGTTTVTGVGFTPKLVIFFGVRTPGTQGQPHAFRIGVDDGITHYGKAINAGNIGAHAGDGYMSNTQSIVAIRMQAIAELMILAHIQSFNSDGFVVKWDVISVATGVRFYAICIGGSDFNAKVFGLLPTTSTYSYTSLSWKPTGLLGIYLADTFNTVLLPDNPNPVIGFAGDVLCGQATSGNTYKSFPAGGIVNSKSYQKNTEWLTVLNSLTGAITRTNTITSLDANGFTITNTGTGTYGCAAFNGCSINVGVFTQPLTTGIQNVPIQAGAGKVAILCSFDKAASSVAVDDAMISFGAGTSSANQKSVWSGALARSTSERANSKEEDNYIGIVHTPTGNYASTLNSRVSLSGLGLQSMLLNWDIVDGVAREWVYMIIGDDLGTGPCGTPVSQTGAGIYKMVLHKTHDELYA